MGYLVLLIAAAAMGMAFDVSRVLQNNYAIESILKKKDPALYHATVEMQREADGIKKALQAPVPTLIYLTSASVPPAHLMQLSKEAARYGMRVHPVLRGIDDGTAEMARQWRDALEGMSPGNRSIVRGNTAEIRVSPRLFSDLNATHAPVIAVASCRGERPFARYCELGTVSRGETSLQAMAKARFGSGGVPEMLFDEVSP